LISEAEGPTTENSARLTNAAVASSPEMVPTIDAVPDKLAEAWDAVKDDPGVAKANRELDTIGVCPLARLLSRCNLILASR
jgi:hypothetical protein